MIAFVFYVGMVHAQMEQYPVHSGTHGLYKHQQALDFQEFLATANLLDAIINSLNALNAMIRKEAYRNHVADFNNPASSALGFSLETEVLEALKPIMAKTRNADKNKVSGIVSSLLNPPGAGNLSLPVNGSAVFPSLITLVGQLVWEEKRVTRADLDSFVVVVSRYFALYDKLFVANQHFDDQVDELQHKLIELEFDIRQYVVDIVVMLHPNVNRIVLKGSSLEELHLKYLAPDLLLKRMQSSDRSAYPVDGIKGAKELNYDIQKRFSEYQRIYKDNYVQIRMVLEASKSLGKGINQRRVEQSLTELGDLYVVSYNADINNLRLATMTDRLNRLVEIRRN